MRKMILCSMTSLLLMACLNKATKFPYNTRLPDGYYENLAYSPTLYLRISQDTAFADFMIIDKFPRYLESDTLFCESSGKSWKSKQWKLMQSGAYYVIFPVFSDNYKHKVQVRKIRTNKLLSKRAVDRDKNYAYVNMEQSRYQQTAKDKGKYNLIRQRYRLFDSLENMSHEDLLIAFKKFKEELYQE